jgi:mannonate dehydratase
MKSEFSRRKLIQALSAAALSPAILSKTGSAAAPSSWPPPLGQNTPKICLGGGQNLDEAGLRRLKQVGVDYFLGGGPRIPWDEADIRSRIEKFKAGGITLCNLMISGFNDVIWGRPGADAQIEDVIKSIQAAGKAGLPVIEYNFYAHRLTEGYKEEIGRAGAGYTAYDYELSKSLPPREGTHTRAEQLKRAEHFLKAIVPEAEKAKVRLALHPNDPPVPLSRGSEQIMASFEQWKAYLNLVKSPYNGMTSTAVLRGDGRRPGRRVPLPGERDCISTFTSHVVVQLRFYRVFIDEGQVNMLRYAGVGAAKVFSRALP